MDGQSEKELLALVKEMLKWIRFQAQPVAKSRLEDALPESVHRRLYQALDGKRTQGQLAESLKTSQPTVSHLISSWVRLGIVEEDSPGRYTKSFDLNTLGVNLDVEEK